MPIPRNISRFFGRPCGVALRNGRGVSGVFCGIRDNEILLIEYLYRDQFALQRYPLSMVDDINAFPPCRSGSPQTRVVY